MRGRLQDALCRLHHRAYCHLTGNGTAGLYLALQALGLSSTRMAIPNNVCPNVPLAVHLAGAHPAYCDVSPDCLGLDLRSVQEHMPVAGIIGVHAYGSPCQAEILESWCADRGIPFIEDAAVAQGVTVRGRPAGSFGVVSVVSFGAGKVVDVGIGGALLTDDEGLLGEIRRLDRELPAYQESMSREIAALSRHHTTLYNDQYLSGRHDQLPESFRTRALAAGPAFLHQFPGDLEPAVLHRVEAIDALVRTRRESAAEFVEHFAWGPEAGVRAFDFPAGSVPWRFNLFVARGRNALLRALLAEGFKVSSWFPSVDLFFEPRSQSGTETPVSDEHAQRILNLWVDQSVDRAYARAISARIRTLCA